MSNLQNFLAPFSHLVFANRNIVIVLLCAGLFFVALDALIHRWRATRLETDLSTARSGVPNTMGRRYSSAHPAEEVPAESGALPPVKGGRTYARNLGSALHKAGMSGPQIYSPPTPAGWAPNANPMQPAPQPGIAPPYATPNVPWAAPGQQGPAPWAYPAGGGRGVPAQPPTSAPYYQPPMPAQPQPQTSMPQPQTPGLYAPPPPATFGQPAFPTPTSGPAAPSFAPPGAPVVPAGASPFQAPYPEPPAGEPAGGRRGKPKRRRFNFNVLENLEKMVQAKPAEAPPSTGWTPPVTPPAPPAALPVPPAAFEPASPPKPAETEEKSLPLQFGPLAAGNIVETTPAADQAEPPVNAKEPAAVTAPEADQEASQSETAEPEAAPEPEPRRSMRSMLFGEETGAAQATQPVEPEPATAAPEPETEAATSSFPSYPWSRDQESTTPEPETAVPSSPASDEAAIEPAPEPVSESASSTAFDPWKPPSNVEEPVPDAATTEPAEASAQVPESPVEVDAGGSGAGTVVIIEDDQTAASYYATLFRGNGYNVEVANDGVSGVDLCARIQPQVILLDVMMPRQNGILVLQTLRASDETKNTPVVVMSNFSEPTLIKRALQLGALEYVIKTQVEGPALLTALPRWMNREKAFAAA